MIIFIWETIKYVLIAAFIVFIACVAFVPLYEMISEWLKKKEYF